MMAISNLHRGSLDEILQICDAILYFQHMSTTKQIAETIEIKKFVEEL